MVNVESPPAFNANDAVNAKDDDNDVSLNDAVNAKDDDNDVSLNDDVSAYEALVDDCALSANIA